MSYPFESRTHARLRRRLLAAMGLVTGCATELDPRGGGPIEQVSQDAAAPHLGPDAALHLGPDAAPSDAGTPITRDGSVGTDATANLPVTRMCDRPAQRQCLNHATLEQQSLWGNSMIRPVKPLRSEAEANALFLPNGCLPPEYVSESCCNPALGPGVPEADGCCYEFCVGSCCGRPFLIRGKARTAGSMRRGDWLAVLPSADRTQLARAVRARIAAEWLEDARMEHASVAAFARFSLELLAFGAPPELLIEAHAAGLDEIEHARLCFAVASQYAGEKLGPTPLSMAHVAPAASLRESVLSAVLEGCIGETLAAARAEAARAGARDQTARSLLTRIAEDEARHAELAYRYVAWALAQEPALAAEIGALVARESARVDMREAGELSSATSPGMEDEEALRAAGRLSEAEERAIRSETFAQVILPCFARLLPGEQRAA